MHRSVIRRALPLLFLGACTADAGGLVLQRNVQPDAGTPDSGIMDAGEVVKDAGPIPGGETPPSLEIYVIDQCDCEPGPCCPSLVMEFRPGSEPSHFYMCGDFVACRLPSIGWEVLGPTGWRRISTPEVSDGGGFSCAPETLIDPWGNGVPYPPSGTVRAVGLFTDDCGASRNICSMPCDEPFEVYSNELDSPFGPIDG